MIQPNGQPLSFTKMHGSGNDFVLIDNRQLALPVSEMSSWAEHICKRAFGISADGLIFLQNAPANSGCDYMWHFYNADGSRAEMCGNGSRCAARHALALGLAGPTQVFLTDAGPIHANVLPNSTAVKVQLTPPTGLTLNISLSIEGKPYNVHFVNTGVPHAVIFVEDVSTIDMQSLGRALRYHEHFAPAGTNANFVQKISDEKLLVRTYERGVEGETFACGTGASASALIAHKLGLTKSAVSLTTSGGEQLKVFIEDETLFLQGPAVKTFSGEMDLGAVGLNLPTID